MTRGTAARVIRFTTFSEDLRLLDPLLALDPAREAESLIDAVDVGWRPVRDIVEVAHAQSTQALAHRLVDGANSQKIVKDSRLRNRRNGYGRRSGWCCGRRRRFRRIGRLRWWRRNRNGRLGSRFWRRRHHRHAARSRGGRRGRCNGGFGGGDSGECRRRRGGSCRRLGRRFGHCGLGHRRGFGRLCGGGGRGLWHSRAWTRPRGDRLQYRRADFDNAFARRVVFKNGVGESPVETRRIGLNRRRLGFRTRQNVNLRLQGFIVSRGNLRSGRWCCNRRGRTHDGAWRRRNLSG